jgi:hypothetical protein
VRGVQHVVFAHLSSVRGFNLSWHVVSCPAACNGNGFCERTGKRALALLPAFGLTLLSPFQVSARARMDGPGQIALSSRVLPTVLVSMAVFVGIRLRPTRRIVHARKDIMVLLATTDIASRTM